MTNYTSEEGRVGALLAASGEEADWSKVGDVADRGVVEGWE